tara:strand:+ start:473 stop:820 length:348 start_codon:yes stop_codon:yes gene_type:complete
MTTHHGNEITIQRPEDWGNMGHPQWHRNILVNGELAGFCWGDNIDFAYPNNQYWARLCWGRFENNRIDLGYWPSRGKRDQLLTLRDVRRAIGWELESLDYLAGTRHTFDKYRRDG